MVEKKGDEKVEIFDLKISLEGIAYIISSTGLLKYDYDENTELKNFDESNSFYVQKNND